MGCGGSTAAAVTGGKARVVFVIGGPGSGKGTQCAKIKSEFNYNHMSTGDVLRNVVKNKQGAGWQELEADMQQGKLIPSSKLISYVKVGIMSSQNKKILLDGFPRNQENLDEWNKQMKDVADVVAVVYFELSDEVMKERLLGRNEGRADDNEETIAVRIKTFNDETKPVIDAYEKEGKLVKIDASKSVDDVFADVKQQFMDRKLYQ